MARKNKKLHKQFVMAVVSNGRDCVTWRIGRSTLDFGETTKLVTHIFRF